MSSRVIAESWTPPYPTRHPQNFEALSKVYGDSSTPTPKPRLHPWVAIPLPLDPVTLFTHEGVIEAYSKIDAERRLVNRYWRETPIEIIVDDVL